jgi:prophage regulatory protein
MLRDSGREKASPIQMLRFPAVVEKTGLSKSAVYQRIREGDFPAPVALGGRAVGFVADEVEEYLANLIERSRRNDAETSSSLKSAAEGAEG